MKSSPERSSTIRPLNPLRVKLNEPRSVAGSAPVAAVTFVIRASAAGASGTRLSSSSARAETGASSAIATAIACQVIANGLWRRNVAFTRLEQLDGNAVRVFDKGDRTRPAGRFLRTANDCHALVAQFLDNCCEIALDLQREMLIAVPQIVRCVLLEIVDELDVRIPIGPHERHVGVAGVVVRSAEKLQAELVGVKIDRLAHVVDEDRCMKKAAHRSSVYRRGASALRR